jgi:hypothetical protein
MIRKTTSRRRAWAIATVATLAAGGVLGGLAFAGSAAASSSPLSKSTVTGTNGQGLSGSPTVLPDGSTGVLSANLPPGFVPGAAPANGGVTGKSGQGLHGATSTVDGKTVIVNGSPSAR